ncbi:MAG: class I SAM-dependent methyltransferase [Flavitalea sp.]
MKSWLPLLFLFIYGVAGCQPVKHKAMAVNNNNVYVYRSPSVDGTGKYYLGREIAKVMDASGADWLERPERQTEENAELAIDSMKLGPQAVVADIGAGTGYYTFRIASKVPKGKVYAVDVQEELIRYLEEKKSKTGMQHVEVVMGDSISVNLPDNSLDLAIMVDVYHELAWPQEILQSIRKSLKPDGRILLIEYRGEDPSIPIKALHKTTVTQISSEMKANDFIIERQEEFLPIQHFLVFRKKE